jgi:hypothetical protein
MNRTPARTARQRTSSPTHRNTGHAGQRPRADRRVAGRGPRPGAAHRPPCSRRSNRPDARRPRSARRAPPASFEKSSRKTPARPRHPDVAPRRPHRFAYSSTSDRPSDRRIAFRRFSSAFSRNRSSTGTAKTVFPSNTQPRRPGTQSVFNRRQRSSSGEKCGHEKLIFETRSLAIFRPRVLSGINLATATANSLERSLTACRAPAAPCSRLRCPPHPAKPPA